MVDINNIRVGSSQIKDYFGESASSFWMGNQMNMFHEVETSESGMNHAKLAETQRAIANFVTIVTGKHLPVIFKGQDSYTDGKEVVIGTKIDDKGFDSTVGLALHEGSHIAHTNFKMIKSHNIDSIIKSGLTKGEDISDWLGGNGMISSCIIDKVFDLMNWVEDRRIDFLTYKAAPGYRMYYEAMYDKYFNSKIIDKALISKVKNQETWDDYMFHIINFVNPNRDLKLLEKLQEIWDTINLANISRLKSTKDSIILAISIYKIISKQCDSDKKSGEAETKPKESEKKDSECKNGESECDKKEDSEDNKNKQQSPVLSGRQLKQLEKAIDKQREFIAGRVKKEGRGISKKDSKMLNTIKESGTEIIKVNYDIPDDQFNYLKTKDQIVEALVIRKLTPGVIDTFPEYFLSEYRQEDQQVIVQKGIAYGKQLGRKLKLRTEERSLKTTRLEHGRIDKRLIAQLGSGIETIFHQIVTDTYKNFFIHISIDASGSMGGHKWDNALMSAVAIAQAASMTKGIRVQISIRGTGIITNAEGISRSRPVTIYVYDSKTDKMTKIKKLFKHLDVFGATPEGFSFRSIEKFILKDAQQEECLFINYSDGMPTTFGNGQSSPNSIEFTRRAIDRFKEHGIQILSFFITSHYQAEITKTKFRRMYGQDSKFIDPTSIPKVAKSLNDKFLEQHVA